jgi:hypothetical protein
MVTRFANAQEFYNAAKREWEQIDQRAIDSLLTILQGRCQVYINLKGKWLNDQWGEVHKLQHTMDPLNTPVEPDEVEQKVEWELNDMKKFHWFVTFSIYFEQIRIEKSIVDKSYLS